MMICSPIIFTFIIDHEVLVEKPDAVKSIREADIVEDDHHNVETTKSNQEGGGEDDDDMEYEVEQYSAQPTTTSSINENGDYVEEIKDGNFYQKKVVKSGPGFSSVTIVSSGSFNLNTASGDGGSQSSGDPNIDIISSMFNEMSRIMGGIMGGMDSQQPSRPEDQNALVPSNGGGGFLAEEP